MTSEFQFDAFISYNRNDIAFAAQLEKALEHYSIPKSIRRGIRPDQRRLKVFRDTDDMTGTDYVKAIRRHLDASSRLIVVCSPDSRASAFVNEEVEYYIRNNPPESVIPVLFRGIPNNEQGRDAEYAFPPALVEAMGMPLGVDYRSWTKGSPKAKPFRNAWFSMLADLLGVSRDEIEERDRRQKAARNRTWGAIAAGVLLVTGLLTANWWAEREVREAVEQISIAQGQLQLAVNTRNTRTRAQVLAGMADLPEVDGVLESAISTGMSVSSWWFGDLPGDYAISTWEKRIESTLNQRIRPLAAATNDDRDCEFRLPGTEFVEGLTSPDGSLDIYVHDNALFLQNASGLGPAMVTCMRKGGWDSSSGSSWWREGTEKLTGRVAFGTYRGLPVAMVKDGGGLSLNVVRAFRPGTQLMALSNVTEARFDGNESLEITVAGLPKQVIRLPAGKASASPTANPDRCFSYQGDHLTVGEILELHGIHGYQTSPNNRYDELRACTLDNGRVLAFTTSTYGEFANVGIVAALDAQTKEELFLTWAHSEDCTAFGLNTLSYCTIGDLSSDRVTDEVGFWHFDEANTAYPLEDEKWPEVLYGHALASPDEGKIALWGSVWDPDLQDSRPVVIWLEDRAQPRPFLLEEFDSPVAEVSFSPDSRYLMVRRDDGSLNVYSFETRALLRELGERVADLQ